MVGKYKKERVVSEEVIKIPILLPGKVEFIAWCIDLSSCTSCGYDFN